MIWRNKSCSCGLSAIVISALVALAVLCSRSAQAQALRFSNHREIAVPEYTTVRIGPFYSSMAFSQSAGYRYTKSSGTGTDFLFAMRRGVIKEDGSEFPLVSILDFRNYLLITRRTDLDISLRMNYAHYPLETQEDEFNIDLAEEGIVGNLSMEFALSPFVKGTVYDSAIYQTDYIDTRGITDEYGGQEYEHFENIAGLNMDWLIGRDMNLAFSAARADILPRSGEFEDQERVSWSESMAYEQRLNPFIVAGMRSGFDQTAYAVTNRPDSASQAYSIYSQARLTRHTRVAASIGYSISSVSSSAEKDEDEIDDCGVMTAYASLQTRFSREILQSFAYTRGQRGGFSSAFEIFGNYKYKIGWKGELASAALYSGINFVEPGRRSMNEYSDWTSGLNVSYPLVPYITLLLSTTYSVRENKGAVLAGVDEEWRADYNTWSSRIGTSFSLMRDIKFSTNFQHAERESDSENLDYERDIFSAVFTYSHKL